MYPTGDVFFVDFIASRRENDAAPPFTVRSHDLAKATPQAPHDTPIIQFAHQAAWAAWLHEHHASSAGVWLRIFKTATGIASVSYAEALETALCYGWIDGQKKSHDEAAWLQKFTPRRAKSIWSKVNREKAETLIRIGQMQPAGLAAVEQAKQDGRWDAAYDSQSKATVPPDFQAELDKHAAAKAFFATLNSQNRYAILFRIQTAKRPETRSRRMAEFIDMLARHEVVHP
jgi:uncharacterized protein YdeI (YjbR/CyaY-like superfamily)